MKKNKNHDKIMFFTIIIMVIGLMTGVFVEAKSKITTKTYKKMLQEVYNLSGKKVKTPEPSFNIYVNDKFIMEATSKAENPRPYDSRDSKGGDRIAYDMPDSFTVNIGDRIKFVSTSKPGSGSKIKMHDWQSVKWDQSGKVYPGTPDDIQTPSNTYEIVADKPGHILGFLNVMDDARFYYKGTRKPITYDNWSNQGDWVTDGKLRAGENYLVEDWYYTPIRFRVADEEGSNIAVTELELIDESGKVVDSFKRELDFKDPIYSKGKTIRTTTTHTEAPLVKPGDKFTLRSKMRFVSFKEGKFDINNPSSMTAKQKAITTEIPIDRLNYMYKYDKNISLSEVYNEEGNVMSIDKRGVPVRNNEELSFEWEYTVPEDGIEEYIALSVKVPWAYREINENFVDDWATVFAKIKNNKNDIGMKAPITMLKGGSPQQFVEIGEGHSFEFNVHHYDGEDVVGEGPENKNPKVKVDVTITDGKKTHKETIQADRPLKPGETIKMPITKEFASETGTIKVCGVVNPIHEKLGYNFDKSNDLICAEFGMVKNYSIKDLKVIPSSIYLGFDEDKDGNMVPQDEVETPVTFQYVAGHEEMGAMQDKVVSPEVVLYHNGKVVWTGTIELPANKNTPMNTTLNLKLPKGENTFGVEINPRRLEKEIKPGMKDPYVDNKKTTSIIVKEGAQCVDCEKIRNRNTWSEKFTWTERYSCRERRRKDGSTSCRCRYKSWSEEHWYRETFKMQNVFMRTKWSKDVHGGDGWIDVKSVKPKIKSGYGFEVRVKTRYVTNRNILPPPHPYNHGWCSDKLSRSPGVTPIDNNEVIYMELPFIKDQSGNSVCYILSKTVDTGTWYNRTKEFQIPIRLSFDKKLERKIYVKEHAEPKNYDISIRTSLTEGYIPNTPMNVDNKETLQDCIDFKLQVLPQDDMKTHIVQ